jgi:hypothetical protein
VPVQPVVAFDFIAVSTALPGNLSANGPIYGKSGQIIRLSGIPVIWCTARPTNSIGNDLDRSATEGRGHAVDPRIG